MENKLRERLRSIIRKRVEKRGSPRVIVSLILLFSTGTGVLCSFILLHSGLETIWFRYCLSIIAAYLSFFAGIKLWLSSIHKYKRSLGIDVNSADGIDIQAAGSPQISVADSHSFSPGGGEFGGGGSQGSWDALSTETPSAPTSSSVSTASSKSGLGFDLDLDELFALIFFIAAVLVLLCTSLYVIYIAPSLLTELIVDGILITGLYKKATAVEPLLWIETLLKKTFIPFLLTLIMFIVAGILIHNADPEAKSIGDLINHMLVD